MTQKYTVGVLMFRLGKTQGINNSDTLETYVRNRGLTLTVFS